MAKSRSVNNNKIVNINNKNGNYNKIIIRMTNNSNNSKIKNSNFKA